MAKYTVTIDERSSSAKKFIEWLNTYASESESIQIDKVPNNETLKAIKEAREGKGIKFKNRKDRNKFLNSL